MKFLHLIAGISAVKMQAPIRLLAKVTGSGLLLAGLTQLAMAQSYTLTNIFTVANGTGNLRTGDNNRGFAFNSPSNQVYVADKGFPNIGVYDGTSGAYLGNFASMSGLAVGTFLLDTIGVSDDGVTYGINLSTASATTADKIYRWADWQATPTVAFSGNALSNGASISITNNRIGDTLIARGSGNGTEILVGVSGKPAFVIFSTADNGLTFTPTIINVPSGIANNPNFQGISFYTNNTFLIKQASSSVSTIYLIQYPVNYASSQIVTGTVIASSSLTASQNSTTYLYYTPSASFLATASMGNPAPAALFSAGDIAGGAVFLASTNVAAANANGNAAGGVSLGGAGQTNIIYEMVCNNSLSAWGIVSIPPQPPAITAAPVGGTFYNSDTLSVSVSGSAPFGYQWRASVSNNLAGTFTNIPGAITNTLTIATLSTNYYQVIITNSVGAITSTPVQVAIIIPVNNTSVTQLWRVAAGTSGYSYLSSSDNAARGIAYDTNSQRVVVSTTAGPTLNIVDANNGSNIGPMNLTGLTAGGTFSIDQVGIADDGAVYTCNLIYNGNTVVNRWDGPTTTAVPLAGAAYNNFPGSVTERYGDNLAVRGAGANTQILIPSSLNPGIGVGPGTNVLFLTTTDGTNFTATVLGVAGVPGGFAGSGIAFDSGNTFWAKAYNGDLFKIAFDASAGTGSVVLDYSSSGAVPTSTMGLGIDPILNLMSTIVQANNPDDLQLFQLTGSTAPPVLYNQTLLSNNGNANANAAIIMKNNRLYATDVNNGIVGLSYGTPAGTPPNIVTPPTATTAYTNTTANLSVVASGSLPLNYQWRFNSNNIAGANNSTYSITNPPVSKSGYYDVVVYNGSGSVTSAPALLTVLIPVLSPVVTNVWTLAPGSRSYLDSSTYNTRGLAYDPALGHLLVADHFNIYVLNAANNSDLGNLNMSGVPNVGFSQWLVDQVRVADDGVVYACNLQDNSFGAAPLSIVSFPTSDVGQTASEYAWGGPTGADPSGIGARLGDTMAVRGSGLNTQLLMGTPDSNIVILFTNNGSSYPAITFNAIVITVPGAPVGFASGGVAFGAGNTFWAKGDGGYNLRQVAFDLNNPANATVSQVFTAGTEIPNTFTGIGVDVANNILAGVCFNDTPDDLQLYLLSGNTNPPALIDQAFFPQPYINSQLNSATDIKFPWVFALDVNNGILALNYGIPAAPGVTITSVTHVPGSVTINWNNTFAGHSYQVQTTSSLNPASWADIGSPVPATGPAGTYTDNTASGASQFYRVITQ